MSERAHLGEELCFRADGHVADLALSLLADAADDLVPTSARDHADQCEECLERLAGFPVKLNLIDVNDATGRFQPPTAAELSQFRTWLAPLRQPVVRRYSGGFDVAGACGMLAAEHLAQITPRRLA